jgi:hypothetical protein
MDTQLRELEFSFAIRMKAIPRGGEILHGGKTLMPDPLDDLVNSFQKVKMTAEAAQTATNNANDLIRSKSADLWNDLKEETMKVVTAISTRLGAGAVTYVADVGEGHDGFTLNYKALPGAGKPDKHNSVTFQYASHAVKISGPRQDNCSIVAEGTGVTFQVNGAHMTPAELARYLLEVFIS